MTDKLKVIDASSSWYRKGLRFKCTECGKCCTGAPGYVFLTEEEILAIADYLNLSVQEFSTRYLRKVHGRFALLERPRTYDCVFLQEKKCQIYPVRPHQCRTYPWWAENLKSEEAWKRAEVECEGISSEAPIVSFSEIQKQLKNR